MIRDTELAVPTMALTLTQPWATLVAIHAKILETRSWGTNYRGPIAIHAAKGFPSEARQLCYVDPFRTVLRSIGIESFEQLPTAQIIACGTLATCYRFDETSAERIKALSARARLPEFEWAFGDHSAGRFGFRFDNVVALPSHVPARGMLNLWRIPRDVRVTLTEALKAA